MYLHPRSGLINRDKKEMFNKKCGMYLWYGPETKLGKEVQNECTKQTKSLSTNAEEYFEDLHVITIPTYR
jgi:hypothetical protein